MTTDLLRAVVGAIQDVAIVCDVDYLVLAWNRAAEALFGISAADALGHPLDKLPGLDVSPLTRRAIRQLVDRGEPWRAEVRHPRLQGADCWLDWSVSRFEIAGTNNVGYLGIARDITDRHHLTDELLRAEQRYRTLLGGMNEGFALHELICDAHDRPVDYRFLVVNPAFERLTGLKAENLIGHTVLQAIPGTEMFWIERYGQVALTGEPTEFEHFSAPLSRTYRVTAFRAGPRQFAVLFEELPDRSKP